MREEAVTVGAGGDVRGVRELRASRFTLVDRHGNPRAALSVGDDGSPAIHLFDPGEQPRMTLSLEASGAANLKLLDTDGDVRVWVSVSPVRFSGSERGLDTDARSRPFLATASVAVHQS